MQINSLTGIRQQFSQLIQDVADEITKTRPSLRFDSIIHTIIGVLKIVRSMIIFLLTCMGNVGY